MDLYAAFLVNVMKNYRKIGIDSYPNEYGLSCTIKKAKIQKLRITEDRIT